MMGFLLRTCSGKLDQINHFMSVKVRPRVRRKWKLENHATDVMMIIEFLDLEWYS